MPRPPRMFISKWVYHVCNRTAEGLPFLAVPFMNTIIMGILAEAQSRYNVQVCHFCFMMNHYHGIIFCEDAEEFKLFMQYLDGEIAKAIVRLTGVSCKKIWAGRYKAQPILTKGDVIDKIAYTYLNPIAASLVESPDDWEGVSSWHSFKEDEFETISRRILPSTLPKIAGKGFNAKKRKALHQLLLRENEKESLFKLSPYAWKHSFAESADMSNEEIKRQIMLSVEEKIEEFKKLRFKENRKVIGMKTLRESSIYKKFRSKEFRRQPLCLCSDPVIRRLFYEAFKAFKTALSDSWSKWRKGDLTVQFPQGAIRPSMPQTCNILGQCALSY